MTHLETVPLWLALPIALFLVLGSTLTLLGTVGLVQLRSFYDRLHAPTLGTTGAPRGSSSRRSCSSAGCRGGRCCTSW